MFSSRRIAVLLVLASPLILAAGRSSEEEGHAKRRARMEKLFWIEDRVAETTPRRRDAPARELNIIDEEVRQIQAEAAQVEPGAIINISTVVLGCPCEDGPACTEQVWIVAHRPDRSTGILLSKVSGHWTIGTVQRWWLEYGELRSRRKEYASLAAWLEAEKKMMEQFPACTAEQVKAWAQG